MPLATNGVLYLDLGFDLKSVPDDLLPYLPHLFARPVADRHRQGRLRLADAAHRPLHRRHRAAALELDQARRQETAAWLFLRGKAVPEKAGELLAILTDVLTTARLDNRERIRQMVLEEKAGFESSLAGMGNGIVSMRLRAQFIRERLAQRAAGRGEPLLLPARTGQTDRQRLAGGAGGGSRRSARHLINRANMVANVTADAGMIAAPPAAARVVPRAPCRWACPQPMAGASSSSADPRA